MMGGGRHDNAGVSRLPRYAKVCYHLHSTFTLIAIIIVVMSYHASIARNP